MIIFVGDKPSKKNVDPNIPFVGTKSYKTLLGWIADMDINIADVLLANSDKDRITGFNVPNYKLEDISIGDCKFIALGDIAAKNIDNSRFIKYFKLPHPSGLNRKLNDKKWLKEQLNNCKKWINA